MAGLGTDIVSVERLRRVIGLHGDRFLDRCFRPDEIAHARRRGQREVETLASRWAAKEAFIKALGSGSAGVVYGDIEVVRQPDGAPQLRLYGTALQAHVECGGGTILLSLSHEDAYAVATVLILAPAAE